MKGSQFIFNYVHLLYYKCHKINPNRGSSYIDSPDWIKNKIAKINIINKNLSWMFSIKPFINKYSREGISFKSEKRWLENVWKN